ncbi:hypothetical protein V2J09_019203 [Rumex salicifolius]
MTIKKLQCLITVVCTPGEYIRVPPVNQQQEDGRQQRASSVRIETIGLELPMSLINNHNFPVDI